MSDPDPIFQTMIQDPDQIFFMLQSMLNFCDTYTFSLSK